MTSQQDLFAKARDSFVNSLGPGERSMFAKCSSVEELLADAKKIPEMLKPKGREASLLDKLSHFAERLKPYFDVVGIFVQSHPEFAGIAWGAIRLVLQLAANYASFFESFIQALNRLATRLPKFRYYADNIRTVLPGAPSHKLENALTQIYTDLFSFLQAVVKIFTRKDGCSSASPIVVGKLFWKPFDVRFKELIERIELHRDIVQQEIEILRLKYQEERDTKWSRQITTCEERIREAEASLKELEKVKQEARTDQLLRNIQEWLNPPEFAGDLERARRLREAGTATWLFDQPCFRNWKTTVVPVSCSGLNYDQIDTILVVKGNPGCGKTILAAATIDHLTHSTVAYPPKVFYFFFRSGSPRLESRLDAYCAILTQILQNYSNDQDFIDKMLFAMLKNPNSQLNRPTEDNSIEILAMCAGVVIHDGYIVLDAVDECVDSVELMFDICRLSSRTGIKIVIFSRPNLKPLYENDALKRSIGIERATSSDIRLFLQRKLDILKVQKLLPLDLDIQMAVDRLTKRADGMFLWAHLMMTYLSTRALTPRQRSDIVLSTSDPEGLEAMYDRISAMICNQIAVERDLAKRMILLLAYARHSLTSDAFEMALNVANNTVSLEPEDRFQDFAEMIVTICGGVVEPVTLRGPVHDRTISSFQFIHLSAKIYFTQESSKGLGIERLCSSRAFLMASSLTSHLEISRICLSTLLLGAPGQPLHAARKSYDGNVPFLEYATTSWIQHLTATSVVGSMAALQGQSHLDVFRACLEALAKFLSQPEAITAWIETAYSVSYTPKARELIYWIQQILHPLSLVGYGTESLSKDVSDTLEFAADLVRLEMMWGENLRNTPKCIWDEAATFMASRFLASSNSTKATELMQDTNGNSNDSVMISDKCLCKISSSHPNGQLVATVSIWPSRAYQSATENNLMPTEELDFDHICKGWYAQYEAWSVKDSPVQTLQIRIPLDADEVSLQLQHSLIRAYQEAEGKSQCLWSLQFPMAISPSTTMFLILRTVFRIERFQDPQITSCKLRLDLDQQMNRYWRHSADSLKRFLGHIRDHIRSRSEGLGRDTPYKYWCSFAADEQFIAFVDQQKQTNSIAVFRIDDSTDVFARYVSHITTNICIGIVCVPCPKIIFRAEGNLLAILFTIHIGIWAFNHGEAGFAIQRIVPEVQGVSFSQCGNYLILTGDQIVLPIIAPVPKQILDLVSPEPCDTLVKYSALGVSPAYLGLTTSTTASKQLITAGQALQTRAQISSQGASRGVQVNHTGSCAELWLWKNEDGHFLKENVELIKLPKSAGYDSTSVAIHPPQTEDEKLKIVLNMVPRRWNGLSGVLNTKSPIIIHREMSAIARSNGLRRRLTAWGLSEAAIEKPTRYLVVDELDGLLIKGEQNHAGNEDGRQCKRRRLC